MKLTITAFHFRSRNPRPSSQTLMGTANPMAPGAWGVDTGVGSSFVGPDAGVGPGVGVSRVCVGTGVGGAAVGDLVVVAAMAGPVGVAGAGGWHTTIPAVQPLH